MPWWCSFSGGHCDIVNSICPHEGSRYYDSGLMPLYSSAKNNSVLAEWLNQSGHGPSERSETSCWRHTPRPASIPCIALHIAIPWLLHCCFSLCQYSILDEHSGFDGQLSAYIGMGSLGMLFHHDCNVMGDAAITSPRVPSICTQNAILSVLMIPIIPSRQIYVAIDNPSLVLSLSSLTSSSSPWNYMCAANNVSHAENLQSNCCRSLSHLYKFRDRIQVIRVCR
jgi:hypothetical protein